VRASIVAYGNPAPVLEPAEHVFDLVALFVEYLIVFVLYFAIFLRRDAGRCAFLDQGISEPVGVIAAVRKQFFCNGQMR
jgi:hypothetical protein